MTKMFYEEIRFGLIATGFQIDHAKVLAPWNHVTSFPREEKHFLFGLACKETSECVCEREGERGP
jgi:hypothetical protein